MNPFETQKQSLPTRRLSLAFSPQWRLWLALSLWLPQLLGGGTETRFRLTQNHLDLRIRYDAGATNPVTLVNRDGDTRTDYLPNESLIVLPEATRLELPEGFETFGPAGAPLWVLQQSPVSEQPFLGISTEGLPTGVFQGTAQLRLLQLGGPGQFFAWQATEFGVLEIAFNSRDGVDVSDVKNLLVGSHEHLNWGFTAPGLYAVTLEASLLLTDGRRLVSPPTPIHFAVEPLPPLPPFEVWQCERFPDLTNPAIIGPNADPDADGYSNLAEFFFGSNPQTPDQHAFCGVEMTAPGDAIPYFVSPSGMTNAVTVAIASRDTLASGTLAPLSEIKVEPTAAPPGQSGSWIRWSATDTGAARRTQRFYELRLQLR